MNNVTKNCLTCSIETNEKMTFMLRLHEPHLWNKTKFIASVTYHTKLLKLVIKHISLIVKIHLTWVATTWTHLKIEKRKNWMNWANMVDIYWFKSTWLYSCLIFMTTDWSVNGEAGDWASPGELAGDRLCETGLGGALLTQFVPSPGLLLR